ncbi:hypothetical protein AGIG_G25528 [Arapaima gigas]
MEPNERMICRSERGCLKPEQENSGTRRVACPTPHLLTNSWLRVDNHKDLRPQPGSKRAPRRELNTCLEGGCSLGRATELKSPQPSDGSVTIRRPLLTSE